MKPPAEQAHHQRRFYKSRSVEWYTPPELFEALGLKFDLDPAAPAGGVPWVPAARHYSRENDGLSQPWEGRVWLNPPYGLEISKWMTRLAEHGDGLALVFARTDMPWFQRALAEATAVCFIRDRLWFVNPDGKRPSEASAPSVLLAYGLSCSLALVNSALGSTCPIPKVRSS